MRILTTWRTSRILWGPVWKFKKYSGPLRNFTWSGNQNVILQKLGVLTGISRKFQFLRFQSKIFDQKNRIFVLGRVCAFAYHALSISTVLHFDLSLIYIYLIYIICFNFVSWSAWLADRSGTWLSHSAWISRWVKWQFQTHRLCLLNYIYGFWCVQNIFLKFELI